MLIVRVMCSLSEAEKSVQFNLYSTTPEIEKVLSDIEVFLNDIPRPMQYDAELVSRELLSNAVQHGNGNNPDKMIIYSIYLFPSHDIVIEVRDEGPGFDYKSLNMNLPDTVKGVKGTGYKLINALSKEIKFNNTGNTIQVFIQSSERSKQWKKRKEAVLRASEQK